MTDAIAPRSLDDSVALTLEGLEDRSLARPDALFLLATGAEAWAEVLSGGQELELADLDGVPERWRGELLRTGRLGGLEVWAVDDVSGEPCASSAPAWEAGFPVWLAAKAGAVLCVHASAGAWLTPTERSLVGGFAVLRDHLNLSGSSPLLGLGESRLGPLFPDQSRVHHVGLRRAALDAAEALAVPATDAVAACLAGPALETPAERRMLARLGADVSVQALAPPLLACAHAGLACLALVAITDAASEDESTHLAQLVERALRAAPILERLLTSLGPELERAAAVLRAGEGE